MASDDSLFNSVISVVCTLDDYRDKFSIHEALLTAPSSFLRKLSRNENGERNTSLELTIHGGAVSYYVDWIYTGEVVPVGKSEPAAETLCRLHYLIFNLQAPAFRNSILDVLAARLKEGVDSFPKADFMELIANALETNRNTQSFRLLQDFCIWQLSETERDSLLQNASREFERNFWTEFAGQKSTPGAKPPYSEGLHNYYEVVHDDQHPYRAVFLNTDWNGKRGGAVKELSVGLERQKFYAHGKFLKVSSQFFDTTNKTIDLSFLEAETVN